MDFHHPLVQSVAVPLGLALVLTVALRLLLGKERGAALAAAASGMALLAAVWLVLGLPAWPPRSGVEKLPLVLIVGLALGMTLDLLRPPPRVQASLAVGLALFAYLWVLWPQLERLSAAKAVALGMAALVSGLIVTRMDGRETPSANVPTVLAVAGLGLAAVAFNAGSLKLFQLSLALASAVGGCALWNWPQPRFRFGASGTMSVGIAWVVLALLTLLLTPVQPIALLVLACSFTAREVASRIPVTRFKRCIVEPLLIALLAAIPAIAAALLAQPAAPADDPYYH